MEPTTYSTPDRLRVDVRVPAGSVTVRTQDTDTTTLAISGERAPEDLVITFDEEGSGHRLVIEQRKKSRFGLSYARGIEVHLTVPHHTELEVKGGSTDLTVNGAIASVNFNSASGDAQLDEVTGDTSAKVASGDLSVSAVAGDLSFYSASGDIRADSVGGKIVARTASGDVEVGQVNNKVNVTTVSGDVRLGNLVGGNVNLQAVSGDIEVGVAPGSHLYLDLSFYSASGDIRADSVGGKIVARTASGDVEVGQVNNKVNVTTVSGDVRLGNLVGGNVNLQAVSGDIEVGVAPGSHLYLDLSSLSGSTESDLSVSDSPQPSAPAAGAAKEAALKAATVSGDIRVRHSSSA